MRTLFADTFYWAALLNPKDQWHQEVRRFNQTLGIVQIVTTDEVLLDKGYSLTDCISMQTMKSFSITEVLTHDKHFAQEGFTVLF